MAFKSNVSSNQEKHNDGEQGDDDHDTDNDCRNHDVREEGGVEGRDNGDLLRGPALLAS